MKFPFNTLRSLTGRDNARNMEAATHIAKTIAYLIGTLHGPRVPPLARADRMVRSTAKIQNILT